MLSDLALAPRALEHRRMEAREYQLELHGHSLRVECQGHGPALLLLHGVTHSARTWDAVVGALAEHFTVIAPDLPGHGASARTPGEHSLGEYASALRDMLLFLEFQRVTVVGHSLGGGVAMQFVYQFPELTERMVLVSSGGLGRELNPLLRLPTLPGSDWLMSLFCAPWLAGSLDVAVRALGSTGLRARTDLREVWRGYLSLVAPDARSVFLQTLRGLVDLRGQRVSALNRLYLAQGLPTLIVWGERDQVIPVEHARIAHEAVPGSQLEVFPGAGHFPHIDAPERFVQVLLDFVRSHPAASVSARDLVWIARRRSGWPAQTVADRLS
jgi:pimeloyl-ACP methyl ester carboxylesterase